MSRELNSTLIPLSDNGNYNKSNVFNVSFSAGGRREFSFGTLETNYNFQNSRYFSAHSSDFMAHDLEVPLRLRVTDNEDLVPRVYGSYALVGNQNFLLSSGFGLMAWSFRNNYNQSVQTTVYKDWFFSSDLKNQQGTHVRFEYNWEFYPYRRFFAKFMAFIEHVEASHDLSVDLDTSTTTNITYSHNDLGVNFWVEWDFKYFIAGFNPRFFTRQDDNDSSYPTNPIGAGPQINKRRQEYTLAFQPNVTVPVGRKFKIFMWVEYDKTYSNLGTGDYMDRNVMNQVAGASVRFFTGF
jgi:hypothetical protein